jgi:hypothetical protein
VSLPSFLVSSFTSRSDKTVLSFGHQFTILNPR